MILLSIKPDEEALDASLSGHLLGYATIVSILKQAEGELARAKDCVGAAINLLDDLMRDR